MEIVMKTSRNVAHTLKTHSVENKTNMIKKKVTHLFKQLRYCRTKEKICITIKYIIHTKTDIIRLNFYLCFLL